jgi:hypothetical protein
MGAMWACLLAACGSFLSCFTRLPCHECFGYRSQLESSSSAAATQEQNLRTSGSVRGPTPLRARSAVMAADVHELLLSTATDANSSTPLSAPDLCLLIDCLRSDRPTSASAPDGHPFPHSLNLIVAATEASRGDNQVLVAAEAKASHPHSALLLTPAAVGPATPSARSRCHRYHFISSRPPLKLTQPLLPFSSVSSAA